MPVHTRPHRGISGDVDSTILFIDTLRKRADIVLEHERLGLPPLLNFRSEVLLDARQLAQPANYALLRVIEAGDKCWEECVDPAKPPVVVIDPRAGHGPGIGGFKRDSKVRIAFHVGHPVYFVIFFPEPCPGQALADVLAALRHFVEHVAKLHPDRRPILSDISSPFRAPAARAEAMAAGVEIASAQGQAISSVARPR